MGVGEEVETLVGGGLLQRGQTRGCTDSTVYLTETGYAHTVPDPYRALTVPGFDSIINRLTVSGGFVT